MQLKKTIIVLKLYIPLNYVMLVISLLFLCVSYGQKGKHNTKPNIIIIYTDDLGFGDVSCNGTSAVNTPNIDKLAKSGVNFTNMHSTSAICTPSRYSLLTGTYAWRKQGTGIARGDAALIIPTNIVTLPMMLQQAGYYTGAIGKWHLGFGPTGGPHWNGVLQPGPREIGFNYSFLLPATADRVPCVYIENQKIVNLNLADTIAVSYTQPLNNTDPTGQKNPELLKMKLTHGHDMSIVNGVSRIGYMTGGKDALWVDEDIADMLVTKTTQYIDANVSKPFFLYLATHDIHVPRMPHSRFVGLSGMGPRGDAILQLDYTIGAIYNALQKRKLLEKTIIIFTSDNGAVLDDGYKDDAVEKIGKHLPNGKYRGGKYSVFEAGTKVPFIISWKGNIGKGKTSNAVMSQIDLYASLAALVGQSIEIKNATDSKNHINTLLYKSNIERPYVIEHSLTNTLAIVVGTWKYIEPSNAAAINKNTNTELGNLKAPQLYNLTTDPTERNNVAETYPEQVALLKALLEKVKNENPILE